MKFIMISYCDPDEYWSSSIITKDNNGALVMRHRRSGIGHVAFDLVYNIMQRILILANRQDYLSEENVTPFFRNEALRKLISKTCFSNGRMRHIKYIIHIPSLDF